MTRTCPRCGGNHRADEHDKTMTQTPKWTRDRDYEEVAEARMKLVIARYPELVNTFKESGFPLGYKCGPLRALVGREPVGVLSVALDGTQELDMRWHISINGGHVEKDPRLPTWHELVDAAHQIRPGVTLIVGIPPRSWWMADLESGKYVLHLWQLKDENLEKSWMEQRTPGGRRPS